MNAKMIIIIGALLIGTNTITAAMVAGRSTQPAQPKLAEPTPVTADAESSRYQVSEKVSREFAIQFAALMRSMKGWKNLSEGDKQEAVARVMQVYQNQENAAILNSPAYYAPRVDDMLKTNKASSQWSLPIMVRFLSVMEYDFYNRPDRDKLAREVLGPQLYEFNKRRREMEAQQQEQTG